MNLRRFLLIFSLICIFACKAYCQDPESTVTGVVKDAQRKKPLMSVTCRVLDGAGKMSDYAITDATGTFSIHLRGDSRFVEFKCIGYKSKKIRSNALSSGMTVTLAQDTYSLKEVTVRLKPIEIHKDTINYNISAFKDINDKKLEDVLKKLPGIEINDDGKITYKGESINGLNIEGQNLLGNRYNQATKNLPIDAVAQVQVMENDQPVRMLRGRVMSDKATLNIKLKKEYKSRIFGDITAGGGYGDKAAWDVDGTTVNISHKNQLMATLQTNNTGDDLNEYTKEHIDVTDLDSYEPTPSDKTTTLRQPILPIDEKRHTDNKSVSFGISHSRHIGKYGSLRTNVSVYANSTQSRDSLTEIYDGNPPTTKSERNEYKTRNWTIAPLLHFENNAPKTFFIEELSSLFSGYTSKGITRNDKLNLGINGKTRPLQLQNKMQLTFNVGKSILQINSLVRYFRNGEILDVADTSATRMYNLDEKIVAERIFTRNSISSVFNMFRNELRLKYTVESRHDGFSIQDSEYDKSYYLKNILSPEYTMKYAKGYVYLAFPLSYHISHIQWQTSNHASDKLHFSPSLRWSHRFSPKWRSLLSAAVTDDISNKTPFRGTYFSDYRTKVMGTDRLGWNRNKSLSISFNYTDMASLFSWNLMLSSSWQKRDHNNSYDYSNDFSLVTTVWKDIHTRQIVLLSSAEKTWSEIRLFLKSSVNYNRSELPLIQNGKEHDIMSNILSTSLSLSWTKLSWLQMYDDATFNISWQDKQEDYDIESLRSVYNTFRLRLHPTGKVKFGLAYENNAMEITSGKFHTMTFLDADISYVLPKDTELAVKATNLLNQKQYVEGHYSGINYHYYSRPLRGIEFIMSLSVKF